MCNFETLSTKNISKKDLENIAELEQDMWARNDWLWEYVQCLECWQIHSKEDIFWHLSNDIKMKNVAKIKSILNNDIYCNCWWKTSEIYNKEEYIDEIYNRYTKSKQNFLTVMRDEKNEIIWFIDYYINDFKTIYNREFKNYYDDIWMKNIENMIEKNNNIKLPEDIMFCGAMWISQEKWNLFSIIDMLRVHNEKISQMWFWNMFWLYESVITKPIHAIYKIAWWKELWITKDRELYQKVKNTKPWYVSDIMCHNSLWNGFYNVTSGISARKFVIQYKSIINEILSQKNLTLKYS